MSPENLTEAEFGGIVIAERELFVEIVCEPLIDEHPG